MTQSPPPAAPTSDPMADRLRAAEERLRRTLTDNPADQGALRTLAGLLIAKGDLAEAEAAFRRLVALAPDDADSLHTLGRLVQMRGDNAEAETFYRAAIDAYPAHAGALVELGGLLAASGRGAEALPHLARAAAFAANDGAMLRRIGDAHHAAGQSAEAKAVFERALALDPADALALKGLGAALLSLKDFVGAAATLERAKAALPEDAETLFNLGTAYLSLDRRAEARETYAAAAILRPDAVELLNNLGNVEGALGDYPAAIARFRQAIARDPNYANAWNNLGIALAATGKMKEAVEAYERALVANPNMVGAIINLGHARKAESKLDEALALFRRANEVEPTAVAWNGIGQVCQQTNRQLDAIAAFEKALELDPKNAQVHNNMAISNQELSRFETAIEHYMKAIELEPGIAEIHYNLATLVQLLGRYEDVVAFYLRALRLRPDMSAIYPNLMHVQMNLCMWENLDSIIAKVIENTEAELARGEKPAAQYFSLLNTPASAELRLRVAMKTSETLALRVRDEKKRLAFSYRKDGPKIRIGYISPDYRLHSVAAAFRGLLDAHDRADFEWYGFSLAPVANDEMTEHFRKTFHRFHDVSMMTFPDAGKLINGEGIHILIDLAGHTRHNRFEILALEPAPVQVHYLGFGATQGAAYVPYLIADPVEMPPELVRHCSEAVIHLPDTFMATTQMDPADRAFTRAELGLPESAPVFCNFNSHSKFHPRIFDVWMRLLRRNPGSVLWMVEGPETAMRNLRNEAKARNVDPDRLVFSPKIPLPQHLARLGQADVALDTLYHAGGVTTVDALRIGLPIVVLAGDTPNARTGASLVSAIGAPELIANDLDGYERLAHALATDPARRAALRAKLIANRNVEPLFDMERLARHLEIAYRWMWRRHLDGLPPGPFAVPPLPRRRR